MFIIFSLVFIGFLLYLKDKEYPKIQSIQKSAKMGSSPYFVSKLTRLMMNVDRMSIWPCSVTTTYFQIILTLQSVCLRQNATRLVSFFDISAKAFSLWGGSNWLQPAPATSCWLGLSVSRPYQYQRFWSCWAASITLKWQHSGRTVKWLECLTPSRRFCCRSWDISRQPWATCPNPQALVKDNRIWCVSPVIQIPGQACKHSRKL